MIQFEQIIQEEFPVNDGDKVASSMALHNLSSLIKSGIELVNSHLKNQYVEIKTYGTVQINHIATSLLVYINEYLKKLGREGKEGDKKELKYYVGKFFRRFLILIVAELPEKNKKLFVLSLYNSLHETCILHEYKFEELIQFLGIQEFAEYKIAELHSSSAIKPDADIIRQIPRLVLINDSEDDLNNFLDAVLKFEISTEIEKFKNLLGIPKENLAINLNSSKKVFVLQFFAYAKDAKIITHQGCGFNGSIYQVLSMHVVDFDKVFLRGGDAHREIGNARRSKTWEGNIASFEKVFKKNLKSEQIKA